MRSFLGIMGRSPFGPVQKHMEKVHETWSQLRPFFDAFLSGDAEQCRVLRKSILKLEHEADLVKNDIRDHLPKSFFLMVDRRDLLSLLHHQDKLADLCEDIVVVASLREELVIPEDLKPALLAGLDQALATCATAHEIVDQLDELVEASFGGREAERVLGLIHEVGQQEYEVDKSLYTLAKEMYRREQALGAIPLMLWQKILELIGGLANASESIGDHLRLMLYR
jgi:predicted phosphate transport protein (TIGR00153 family)